MKNDDVLVTISIPTSITIQTVKHLLSAAFEGGSNSWVNCIDSNSVEPLRENVPFIDGGWLKLKTIDEETYFITLDSIKIGLQAFANGCPIQFEDVVADEWDADTGDMLLQYICFGKMTYC